ncbi:Gfo/Idh/MocA family protein [Ahrensia sp. R2A130]|uniref:Gfo/Idh/MocA family protein n=1 Tax=Ahrensia sp. R2A130 TaxID=744979 RepID=UPI0001E0A4BE|nr:Gfo/Idh/MocA family oxidoreductase [Ahrensia sp. R2A130]EFL88416.1 NADH-dependent dehydrogenase [Ahrensia sp. R2A130]
MTTGSAPIRVLGVGAGYFSQFQYAAWQADPRVELVGVVDTDEAKAQVTAQQYDAGAHFTDMDTALSTCTPDLVDIITPPPAHLGLIERTMEQRIPTICQKPLCGGLDGARVAADLAARADTFLVVHENFRFQPWYRKAKAMMDEGRLGDIYQVTFRLRPGDGQGPNAYLDRQPYFQKMERLLIYETGLHFIDTFRYLLGEPDTIWADLRRLNPAIAAEDAGLLVFGYEDGKRALFDGNRLADHAAEDQRCTMGEALIEGSQGTLELFGSGQLFFRRHGDTQAQEVDMPDWPKTFGGGCVAALQAHVIDHMISDAPLENEVRDYIWNLEWMEAAYASHHTGRRLDLASWREGQAT